MLFQIQHNKNSAELHFDKPRVELHTFNSTVRAPSLIDLSTFVRSWDAHAGNMSAQITQKLARRSEERRRKAWRVKWRCPTLPIKIETRTDASITLAEITDLYYRVEPFFKLAEVIWKQIERRPLRHDATLRVVGCNAFLGDGTTIDEYLEERKDAGLNIDPKTAEVWEEWVQMLDPYQVYGELPPEGSTVARQVFVRSPDDDNCVWSGDLPRKTYKAIM